MALHMLKSIIGLVVLAFILCFAIAPIAVVAIVNNYGTVNGLVAQVVEPIPFGTLIYGFVANIVYGLLGESYVNVAGIGIVFTFDALASELIKTLLAAIIFAAIRIAGYIAINPRDGLSGRAAGGRLVFLTAAALLAARLAPFLMDNVCGSLGSLHNQVAAAASARISIEILDVGALPLAVLVVALVVKTASNMLMRFLLANVLMLFLAYALVLSYLVGIQCQLNMPIYQGAGMLFVIVVTLGAVELVLDFALK